MPFYAWRVRISGAALVGLVLLAATRASAQDEADEQEAEAPPPPPPPPPRARPREAKGLAAKPVPFQRDWLRPFFLAGPGEKAAIAFRLEQWATAEAAL